MERQPAREGALLGDPERAPCDPLPARAEPLAQVRDRAGPEGHVDVRIEREQPLSLRLGVAAADRDHLVGLALLDRPCLGEVRGKALVGLLPDRAGVEDEHVGLGLVARLAEPQLLEHALDPLGVVGVHLAAESRDVVAAHLPELEPRPSAGHPSRDVALLAGSLVGRDRLGGMSMQAGPGTSLIRVVVALAAVVGALAIASPAGAASPGVVISQVYGGGGNSGAPYTNDFIELFNRGSVPVDLGTWSLQYTSASGTGNFGSATNLITPLNGVLQPGQHQLVEEAGGTTGAPLPTPKTVDTTPINMSATGGKVALVSSTTPLGCNGGPASPCSADALAQIVDLIGYDGANFFEGSAPAPALTNATSASRALAGCQDTDDNAADFAAGAPNPRTLLTPIVFCTPPTPHVAISQVYGGGGNAGATLKNDFIEVFNRGTSAVNLAGWSVQYASSGGTGAWTVTPLNALTLQPGQYYLVQEAQGAGEIG